MWSGCFDVFVRFIVPLAVISSFTSSLLLYILLLICSLLSSSLFQSFSFSLVPLSIRLTHPGGPSFHRRCPSPALHLAPPVCKAGVSQDKEDSDYLTKKAMGSWGAGGGDAHTQKHTHNRSLLLCPCSLSTCICTSHICAPFLSLTLAHTHTHLSWAGLGLGTGRAGAVCLSVISIPAGGSWPGQTSERSSRSR